VIHAIAFDIDQTLWDFHAIRRDALAAVLVELRARATTEHLVDQSIDDLQRRYDTLEAQHAGSQLAQIRRMSLAEAADEAAPGDANLGDDLVDMYFSIRHRSGEPYPDVAPALEALSNAGVRLAVVSNGNTDLDGLGLAHYFETVVLAPEVATAKPEPTIYRIVEDRLGLDAAAMVCVGDDIINDVVAPQRLGWRGVWNRRSAEPLPEGCTPDATIEHLTDLLPLVASWSEASTPPDC
jgi:FMN hydrolase / 5-amino-6-(5-phospho-D-ribitylamino)uracil phosphatase